MSKRITILLEDDLVKKLYEIQSRLIKDSGNTVSFSKVMNDILRKSLKKS